MGYCVKCGTKVDEGARFCPQCGAEIPGNVDSAQQYTYGQNQDHTQQNTYSQQEYFQQEDVKKHKGMGVLSYFGILVLIPLLAGDKNSPYVRFHSNQVLVLFLVSVILDLLEGDWVFGLHSWINLGGSGLSWAFDILSFGCFILMIVGIVTACKGEKRELPIIGKIKILK